MLQIFLAFSYLLFYPTGVELEARNVDNNKLSLATAMINIQAEDPIFKNVKVSGNKGTYTVTGQVRGRKGEFFYTVEDGHDEFVAETKVKSSSISQNGFSFKLNLSFPIEKLPENGVLIMNLYEKSESGEIVPSFPVILDTFYP